MNAHCERPQPAPAGSRLRPDLKINKEVQKQLAEAGFHRCPTCTFPVLDPNDTKFDEKAVLIEGLASGPIPTCVCRACA